MSKKTKTTDSNSEEFYISAEIPEVPETLIESTYLGKFQAEEVVQESTELTEPIESVEQIEPRDNEEQKKLLLAFMHWVNSQQLFLSEWTKDRGIASPRKLTFSQRSSAELVEGFINWYEKHEF